MHDLVLVSIFEECLVFISMHIYIRTYAHAVNKPLAHEWEPHLLPGSTALQKVRNDVGVGNKEREMAVEGC